MSLSSVTEQDNDNILCKDILILNVLFLITSTSLLVYIISLG